MMIQEYIVIFLSFLHYMNLHETNLYFYDANLIK